MMTPRSKTLREKHVNTQVHPQHAHGQGLQDVAGAATISASQKSKHVFLTTQRKVKEVILTLHVYNMQTAISGQCLLGADSVYR